MSKKVLDALTDVRLLGAARDVRFAWAMLVGHANRLSQSGVLDDSDSPEFAHQMALLLQMSVDEVAAVVEVLLRKRMLCVAPDGRRLAFTEMVFPEAIKPVSLRGRPPKGMTPQQARAERLAQQERLQPSFRYVFPGGLGSIVGSAGKFEFNSGGNSPVNSSATAAEIHAEFPVEIPLARPAAAAACLATSFLEEKEELSKQQASSLGTASASALEIPVGGIRNSPEIPAGNSLANSAPKIPELDAAALAEELGELGGVAARRPDDAAVVASWLKFEGATPERLRAAVQARAAEEKAKRSPAKIGTLAYFGGKIGDLAPVWAKEDAAAAAAAQPAFPAEEMHAFNELRRFCRDRGLGGEPADPRKLDAERRREQLERYREVAARLGERPSRAAA